MTDTPITERTNERILADQMGRRITNIAARLRDLADRIEWHTNGIAKVNKHEPGWTTYASVASEVQHDVISMLANLHMEGLTTDAQQADEYRLKGE